MFEQADQGEWTRESQPGQGTDPLLQSAVQRVCDLLEADLAGVALPESGGQLVWRAIVGNHAQIVGQGLPGLGVARQAVAEGHAVSVARNAGNAADFPLMVAEGLEMGLVVPLSFDEQPGGTLVVGWRRPYTLTETEQRLVQALAEQVVSTISLIRLYQATWRQAREQEAVIQQLVEGVAISDSAGNLVRINPAGVALLGRDVTARPPDGSYAQHYQLYDPAGNLYADADLPLEQARQGDIVRGKDVVVHPPEDRERVLSMSAAPLFDEGQAIAGAVAVFHDVTLDREAERIKDEFLALVSHELRTPLAAILGYTDVMLRGLSGTLTEKQRQNQQAIRSSARHLLQLINDLLDFSRIEAHGLRLHSGPVALPDLVAKAAPWMERLAGARGVTLTRSLPTNLPLIWGDTDRLQQVLANLLSNAIKFTPPNGAVVIEAAPSGLPPDAPPTSREPNPPPAQPASVRVSIRDTGVGLRADQLARIWDRFYQGESTTSRSYGGTGLGLAIVKGLIGLHGGTAWATSAGTGQGSTFHFRLPLAASQPRPA